VQLQVPNEQRQNVFIASTADLKRKRCMTLCINHVDNDPQKEHRAERVVKHGPII